MSEPIEGAAPAASDPSSSPSAEAPPGSPPRPPTTPVRAPLAWAKERGVDPALVAGAAILARWPAGNLKDGSLLVSEDDFLDAMKAFAGLEIR